MLELLVSDNDKGAVILESLTGPEREKRRFSVNSGYFRLLRIPLEPDSEYILRWEGASLSLAYLSGCPDLLERGVRFLDLVEGESGESPRDFYDHPYREQYHFSPWRNWMNDPNGLCWFDGHYHLFYQANPFAQRWGNMYWGHAASRDLLHWKHLPYALEPHQALWDDRSRLGGAFSGCAVPRGEEVDLFFTRSEETLAGEVLSQYQVVTTTRDMLHFTPERTVIPHGPPGCSPDFRDPKVFAMNGRWYMVLGGAFEGQAAILLYESDDLRDWRFLHPLLTEPDPSIRAIECPDCFLLDGKYVVTAAWMKHTDDCGRYQMTRYYIGRFEGTRYIAEHTGWFDFGSNLYAVQSFAREGQRTAIGWVSDFYGEQPPWPGGPYGSACIPRVLRVENNRLYMEPVPQIASLHDQPLLDRQDGDVPPVPVAGNSYRCRICFSGDTDFNILLGRQGDRDIRLLCEEGRTRLATAGVKTAPIRFESDTGPVRQLDILVDRRLTEVYINSGESAGAKLFYTEGTEGIFSLQAQHPERVSRVQLHTMQSAW